MHVLFDESELSWLFAVDVVDEEEVAPHILLVLHMMLPAISMAVELVVFDSTNETQSFL